MSIMGTGLLMIAFALSSVAQETAAELPPDIVVEGERPDPDQILCEKFIATGSRVVMRQVCATRQEWDEIRRTDRENLEDNFRRGLQINSPHH